MKVAIIGSRKFTNQKLFNKIIDRLFAKETFLNVNGIVSGGAKGTDTLAENYANEHGIEMKIFLPDWDGLGKSAGFKRNYQIWEEADIGIAFWDGVSKGTSHSFSISKNMNKKLVVVEYAIYYLLS